MTMEITDPLAYLDLIIGYVDSRARIDPELTIAELLTDLRKQRALEQERRDENVRPCKNCKHPIAVGIDRRLFHVMPSGKLADRGCRAASWSRRQEQGLEGWDDLAREMYAQ